MKLVKIVYKNSLMLFLAAPLFFACSQKKDERDAEAAMSALINSNKKILSYGHISVNQILTKADYKSIPLASAVIDGELSTWKEGVDIDKPVYYAVEGEPQNGNQGVVYAIVNVKDRKKLADKFSQMGYTSAVSGEITYYSDDNVTIGVRNKIALLYMNSQQYDAAKAITAAFSLTEGDESKGDTKDIITSKADMVFGVNLERMTASSVTMSKATPAKRDELKKMMADAQTKTEIHFDKGELRITSKNYFSKDLKNILFFRKDNAASAVKKLRGNAWMGFSANVDMRKLETFLADYAPELKAELMKKIPGPAAFALAMSGDNPLTQLFSGQFALISTGVPTTLQPGFRETLLSSEFNFFAGSGTKGQMLADVIVGGANMKGYRKVGNAYVIDEKVLVTPRAEGLYGTSLNGSPQGQVNIPSFAKNFGKNTFSMFIDFNRLRPMLSPLPSQLQVLELFDYVVADADEDGGEFIVKMKNRNENVLRQLSHFSTQMMMQRNVMGDTASME